MKPIITLITSLFLVTLIHPQDRVTLKTGEEQNVKVIEVGTDEIKFKKTPDGPVYVLKKTDIFMITYSDGSKDVFSNAKKDSLNTAPTTQAIIRTDYEKGVRDAEIFYTHSEPSTGTFLTTLFATPLGGLVPAIICSSTSPKEINLNIPLDRKFLSDQYRLGYKEKATNIKKRKVWTAFAIAFGIDVGFYILLKNIETN